MKILSLHAHFDDFEFVASGTFEMWKRKLGPNLRAKVVVCTDGKAGHHFRTREETAKVRLEEQLASAKVGGYEFEPLLLPNGRPPREACMQISSELLAAFWTTIRGFAPDYIFSPPIPTDPLAGLHVDHVTVAEAIRKVAYMINVPHAFTPEYPADETKAEACHVPVILNVYDPYVSGSNQYDLAIDIEDAFPTVCEMTFCHQSQIMEWIPWVGRHNLETPKSLEDWSHTLRQRYQSRNRELGIPSDRMLEVFTVTAWGTVPTYDQITNDFPNIRADLSNLDRLRSRLDRWLGCIG
jgi:LmbE family N-acetylglucosaminyl deacetylase